MNFASHLDLADRQLTAAVVIALFFGLRLGFSGVAGKRLTRSADAFQLNGRFLCSALLGVALPLLLIADDGFNQHLNLGARAWLTGALLAVSGLGFMLAARLVRGDDWGHMGDDCGERLFTHGVYAVCRAPYYFGTLLVLAGAYLALDSAFVLSIVPVALFLLRAVRAEDAHLLRRFGPRFLAYRAKIGILPLTGALAPLFAARRIEVV